MTSTPQASRHRLSFPDGALQRIQAVAVLFNVLASPVALAIWLLVQPSGLGWLETAGLAAAQAGVATWAVAYYRANGRGTLIAIFPIGLVATMGLTGAIHQVFSANLHGVLLLMVLYQRSRRESALLGALFAATYAVVSIQTDMTVDEVAPELFGLVMIALGVRAIGRTVRRHERMRTRDAILTDVTARLLRARSPHEVHGLVVEGAQHLVEDADASVQLWRTDGPRLRRVADVGPQGSLVREVDRAELTNSQSTDGLTVPVELVDGPRLATLKDQFGIPDTAQFMIRAGLMRSDEVTGVLVIASPSRLDSDLLRVIQRYAHEAALAQALVDRDALFSGIVENSADVIVVTSEEGIVRYVSPTLESATGIAEPDVVGQPLSALLQPVTPGEELEEHSLCGGAPTQAMLAGAREFEVEVTGSRLELGGCVLNVRDVRERRRLEAEIEYRAFHDPVTGLANRALFFDRLGKAIQAATRRDNAITVMMIDLDDFKSVNDTLGHAAGDALLAEVARRLEAAVRAEDTVARLGGDEFALLLQTAPDAEAAIEVAQRTLDSLRRPVALEGSDRRVHASIGITIAAGREGDEILRNADAAMYAAKAKGKNCYALHDLDLQAVTHGRRPPATAGTN